MAYHHHHHAPPPTAAAPSCYCCYSSTQTHHLLTPTHTPPPPPLSLPDPLLVDTVISRLLHITTNQTPRKPRTHHSYQHYRPLGKTPDLSSLIDRVEALEVSLHRFSFSTSSIVSVRDAAACVIQRRFRAFLARRSRILRKLQDLAVVKSSYIALRSSVSNSSYVRFEHVSRKVDGLLLQLDSIEEDDPMISKLKRSIGKKLDHFLRHVNGRSNEVLSSRRNKGRTVNSGRKDNLRLRAQREMVNDLRGRVERIRKISRVFEKEERANDMELQGFDDFSDFEEKKCGVSVSNGVKFLRNGGVCGASTGGHGMKKKAKFVENRDAYRAISNYGNQSTIEGENDPGDDSVKALEKFKMIEVKGSSKDEEEGLEDSGRSDTDGSDGGMSDWHAPRKDGGSGSRGEHRGLRFVFTPPVPEKMESVADSIIKKKEVKL